MKQETKLVPKKNYILRSELEMYLKAGYHGPFKIRINGVEREYIFNPDELQTVFDMGGKCPCKPFDRCLCPTFLKYGVCVCKLFIEVVNSEEEYKEKVRMARELAKKNRGDEK